MARSASELLFTSSILHQSDIGTDPTTILPKESNIVTMLRCKTRNNVTSR
eukprot:m.563096 g.563096  ORF g.563096 m.563096 type:complete len:50 (-) comp22228_c1_seq6:2726-2875(-)